MGELVNRTVDIESENEIKKKEKMVKDERNRELAILANRKVDNIEIVAEDKTSLLREERRKELEEISNRKVDIDFNQKSEETLLREERAKELFDISNRTTDAESEMQKSKESIVDAQAKESKAKQGEMEEIKLHRAMSLNKLD